ncbi:hypothetical protein P280DRAFT_485110 [Massarina eburnea CBS 473.64]|uniref:AA1-like domain-containing protein n=1 Tax=Massarina eburnea CBS 473.64 TaxID=1395130 RepID=A0A6A6RK78_9PLEO|nr:hypothetical protein P280DRAFT_485110 [Massarina eburnea CBS 473.64]
MQFTTPLFLLAAAASTASGYVIQVFTDSGCKGNSQQFNVYDNTCHTTGQTVGYRSFQVKAYGAGRQRAGFFQSATGCNALAGTWNDYWADGGSDSFKKDRCIEVGFSASSFGSRSA